MWYLTRRKRMGLAIAVGVVSAYALAIQVRSDVPVDMRTDRGDAFDVTSRRPRAASRGGTLNQHLLAAYIVHSQFFQIVYMRVASVRASLVRSSNVVNTVASFDPSYLRLFFHVLFVDGCMSWAWYIASRRRYQSSCAEPQNPWPNPELWNVPGFGHQDTLRTNGAPLGSPVNV